MDNCKRTRTRNKLKVNNIKWIGGQKPATGFCALVIELTSEKGREFVGKYFSKKRSSRAYILATY